MDALRVDPLRIGSVVAVEGDSVEVQISLPNLMIDYHGTEYRVGRLGSYITIPIGNCTLIGYVTRVGVAGELEPGPEPTGPRRLTLTAQLLGTVRSDKFSRGVAEYPTVGDTVRLGVDEDFELIFGSFEDVAKASDGAKRSFSMGRFAVDQDFEVKVLGKEFFAKHVAVMGNSGSGKSCCTAKIVHEALKLPHAQVVMFDMHGEYLASFADEHYQPDVNVTYLSDKNLILPYWMLQFDEFEQLFIDASNPENVNSQKIFLRQALRQLKQQSAVDLGLTYEYSVETPIYYSIAQLLTFAENLNECRFVLNSDNYAFARLPFRQLPREEQDKLLMARRMEFNRGNAEGEVPHATFYGRLLGFVNLLESRMNDRRYDFILRPFEQVKRNPELAPYFKPEMGPRELSTAVSAVIRQLLGRLGNRKNLTIVDLSGLPFDVVDVTVAVLTRALFDFNFWTPNEFRQPTLIVYEEAHNYLPRIPRPGRKTFARDAVEKVAKEGRKYGVSAMVVSQRPSEISETLLSQCGSMVLLRMNNPDDQDYAARVVSDQFRSLISMLPSLRPGEGFIIGDSVLMPMRTLIDLPPRLPRSNDVDFFGLWRKGNKPVAVEHVVRRWWKQQRQAPGQSADQELLDDTPASAKPATAGAPSTSFGTTSSGSPDSGLSPGDSCGFPGGIDASAGSGDGGAELPGTFVEDRPPGPSATADPQGNLSPAQRKLADLVKMLTGG